MESVEALARIVERARRVRRRIAFAESTEPRTLRAVARLAREGIARPVLVGVPEEIERAASREGVDLQGCETEDLSSQSRRSRWEDVLQEAFTGKTPPPGGVRSLLDHPLYVAACLVRSGEADGSVAGAAYTTAETLRAALRVIRPAAAARIVSSFFLMGLREPTAAGDDVLAFSDCGLIPEPDADQLAEIGIRTAESFRRLLEREPRVAFLSFSSKGSAEHPAVAKVVAASERFAALRPDIASDGELQADAALVPTVGEVKAPNSPVAGRANVLIFPNLDAGNIAYKLVQRLAGARAVGPILQGLRRPANDLSRGCSVEEIVLVTAVTSVQAESP